MTHSRLRGRGGSKFRRNFQMLLNRQRNPYASFKLAYDFVNGSYTYNAAPVTPISSLPGYVYTDSIDNLPNLSAAGYTGVKAENPVFRTSTPINTEQDFIMYGVFQIAAATDGSNQWLFSISDGSINNIMALSRNAAGAIAGLSGSAGVFTDALTGITVTTASFAVILRRRSTKVTCAIRTGGTTTIGAESAVTSFPVSVTRIGIGSFDGLGTGGPNPSFVTPGLFIETGTFDDAALTAKLATLI